MNEFPGFDYDPYTDIFTIYGIRYSGGYFRNLAQAPVGTVLEVIGREDGLVTVRLISTEIDARRLLKDVQERDRMARKAQGAGV